MAFAVPDLPYAYDALEPHIDAETMRIHHDLHHGAYVTNANAALEGTALADAPVENVLTNLDALPEDKQTAVRNNAGGHANHSLFWQVMGPDGGGEPGGALRSAVEDAFGSFDELRSAVNDATSFCAASLRSMTSRTTSSRSDRRFTREAISDCRLSKSRAELTEPESSRCWSRSERVRT